MTGIYIHIPFCIRKCPYCDFYSLPSDSGTREEYTEALIKNILMYKGRNISADTVYFGGGTPSLLSVSQVERIISACAEAFMLDDPEITVECNPDSTDREKLSGYRQAGVNRISFGIQSAQDCELGFLGRPHSFSQARQAVYDAFKAGFENISGDVMLGLAGQTYVSLRDTLDKLCKMPLSHISAYMLKIEEGTPFDCERVKNSVTGEDELCEMYLQTVEFLEDRGFKQYEISNFARDNKISRHNMKYWRCCEYLGFGASAHSFFEGKRFYCPSGVGEYICGGAQKNVILEEAPDRTQEYIMLGLRLSEGVKLEKLCALAGEDFSRKFIQRSRILEQNGLCRIRDGAVSLTPRGFLVSNSIICQLADS